MRCRALLAALVATACTPAEVVLVDQALWSPLLAQDDPFTDRPVVADCPTSGWGVEGELLEVSTGICRYFCAAQPSEGRVRPGGHLVATLSHDDLEPSVDGATAHAALALDGEVLWETRVPIPADAGAIEVDVPLPDGIEPGELLLFHLHNHGANTWNLSPLVGAR